MHLSSATLGGVWPGLGHEGEGTQAFKPAPDEVTDLGRLSRDALSFVALETRFSRWTRFGGAELDDERARLRLELGASWVDEARLERGPLSAIRATGGLVGDPRDS